MPQVGETLKMTDGIREAQVVETLKMTWDQGSPGGPCQVWGFLEATQESPPAQVFEAR